MKKVILILMVLLCAVSIFAEDKVVKFAVAETAPATVQKTTAKKNAVRANLVPYALQISASSVKGQDAVHSKYGIGFEAMYVRQLDNWVKGLYAEAGIGWDTFLIKDRKPEAFTNLMAFAGVGYNFKINDTWSVFAHVDMGTDTLLYNKKGSETLTVKTGVGAGYAINDRFTANLTVDGTVGFAKKDGAKYANWRILPMLGATYNF